MNHCNLFVCVLNKVPIQVQAKDSRSVLAAAVPTGSKAAKLPTVKMAAKTGKKQGPVKKNDGIPDTESTGDKNEKTKPQVTHELSMVR